MSMKCDLCQVDLNSSVQYNQHMVGKMHAKKLKLKQDGNPQPQLQPKQQPKVKQQPQQLAGSGRPIMGGGPGGAFGGGRGGRGGERGGRGGERGGRGGERGGRGGERGGRGARGSFMRGGPRGRGGPINFVQASNAHLHSVGGHPASDQQVYGDNFTSFEHTADFDTDYTDYGPPNPGYGAPNRGRGGNNRGFGANNRGFGANRNQRGHSPNWNPRGRGNMGVANSPRGFRNFQQQRGRGAQRGQLHHQQQQQQKQKQQQKQEQQEAGTGKKKKKKSNPEDQALPSEPLVFGDYMGVAAIDWTNFDPKYCAICMVNMTSAEQAEFHYRGQKHARKAKIARLRELGALDELAEPEPPAPKVQASGEGGGEGENQGGGGEGDVQMGELSIEEKSNGEKKAVHGNFYCGFCNITVNSDDQMKIHREGQKHKKMMEVRKRHMGEATNVDRPVAKKPSPESTDPTDNIPIVHPSQILPFDQMFPSESSVVS